MTFRRIFAAVGQHAHLSAPEEVLAALSAFLRTLSERVQSRDALLLARDLPAELQTYLLSPPRAHGEVFSGAEFLLRMSAREHVSAELAAVHARVICAVLGANLPGEAAARLQKMIPAEFRRLLEPLSADELMVVKETTRARGMTS